MALRLQEVCDEAYQNSIEHGFWDDSEIERSHLLATKLMLIVTEVAEAMEDVRAGSGALIMSYASDGKPEGLPSELADIIIRVGDLCGFLGIDLDLAVRKKLAHNRTRPMKHGGKTV